MSNVVRLRTEERVLTKRELARHLRRSERWIERKVRDGMPVLDVTDRWGRRRYSLNAVQEWLDAGQPKPKRDRVAELEARVRTLEERVG